MRRVPPGPQAVLRGAGVGPGWDPDPGAAPLCASAVMRLRIVYLYYYGLHYAGVVRRRRGGGAAKSRGGQDAKKWQEVRRKNPRRFSSSCRRTRAIF